MGGRRLKQNSFNEKALGHCSNCDRLKKCNQIPASHCKKIHELIGYLIENNEKDMLYGFFVAFRKDKAKRISDVTKKENHQHDYYLPYDNKLWLVCRTKFDESTGMNHWTARNWTGENAKYTVKSNPRRVEENVEKRPLTHEEIIRINISTILLSAKLLDVGAPWYTHDIIMNSKKPDKVLEE